MGGHGTHVTDNGDSSSCSVLYLMAGTTEVFERYIVCPALSGADSFIGAARKPFVAEHVRSRFLNR